MIDKVVFVFLAALTVTTALDVPLGFELVGKKYVVSTAQVRIIFKLIKSRDEVNLWFLAGFGKSVLPASNVAINPY